jgi:hypothetical protein
VTITIIMAASSPISIVLPTLLLAVASAFIHPTNICQKSTSRFSITLIKAFDDDHNIMIDGECRIISQISQLLKDTQLELLSDPSKLQRRHPQSTVDADNKMRKMDPKQMAHEAILSSRLHLPFLHRTKLGPSRIDGAGRGLFAIENISKGEAISCYPGDAILYELPSSEDEEDDTSETEDDEDGYDEDEEGTETICLWGAHVLPSHRWDEDKVFDGTESTPPLTSYAVSVDDLYSIMGHPQLDDNPAYFGHFANDGAGEFAFEGPKSQNNKMAALELGLDTGEDEEDEELGIEGNIAAYVLRSLEVSNAMHRSLVDGLHVVTVATKDIMAGEEIYVTYGPDYWVENSK